MENTITHSESDTKANIAQTAIQQQRLPKLNSLVGSRREKEDADSKTSTAEQQN